MQGKRLIVVGNGPEMKSLKRMATSNIEFRGFESDQIIVDLLQRAKALVYAAEEDFGIVPVEAQACGTPVIAFGKGGALETVIEGKTGFFFQEQKPDSIIQAIAAFEKQTHLDSEKIRQHAEGFSKARFERDIKTFVEEKAKEFFHNPSD